MLNAVTYAILGLFFAGLANLLARRGGRSTPTEATISIVAGIVFAVAAIGCIAVSVTCWYGWFPSGS